MAHTCHATSCGAKVPPEMLMCKRHWFMLPKKLRDQVWATYRTGQCDDWNITHEYANAARAAVRFIADKEGLKADTRVYDLLDPLPRELHQRTIKTAERQAMAKKKATQVEHEGVLPSSDRFPGFKVTVETEDGSGEWFEYDMDDAMMLSIEYAGLLEQIAAAEKRKKQIARVFKEIHEESHEDRIGFGIYKSENVHSHTAAKLSPEKLVENGVPAETVAASYEPGKEYTYIKISVIEG